jgi:thiol-disulfide isomerase/thioredoxin/uncharacterized membrane protein YphA (DoxX/SURF4 family)
MEIVLLVSRLFLALVFGVAGFAKAVDPAGSRRAIIGFGVPEKFAAALAWCLPALEIVFALALIPVDTAWLGAIGASLLLLIFSIGIAVNLVRGQSPDCHCFGQLHSEPVRWSTFTRNLMLFALAGFIVVQGKDHSGLSALSWMTNLKTAESVNLIFGTIMVLSLAIGVVYLRRILSQQSTLLMRIDAMKKVIDEDYAEAPPVERKDAAAPVEGLPIGTLAPDFSLVSIEGKPVTLDDLLAHGKPLMLLFVSPNCPPCKTLMPVIQGWERDYNKQLKIALLSKGTAHENRDELMKYELAGLYLQGESGVAEEYQAKWSPAAVLIRPDGRIASQITYGDEAIRAIVSRAIAPAANAPRKRILEVKGNGHKPRLTIGTPHAMDDLGKVAPSFSLRDGVGDTIRSDDLLNRDTLLLFWDPKCPFCQGMYEDVRKWEENPPPKAPQLVFICTGSAEDFQVESSRFRSLFLHDPELEIGLLFGTNRTPSVVLIDKEGRIASPPTAGPENVLALAGVRKSSALVASSL